MYERYLYNGLIALFFLSIVDRKYLKYFLILGSISLLNMLQGPLAPKQILNRLDTNNRIFVKFLAILNILIFIRVMYLIKTSKLSEKAK